MTTAYGVLHSFDSSQEDWKSYIQQMKLYFTANDIQLEAKQRAILLTTCGPKTFQTIRSIVAPTDPAEVPLNDLEELIGKHFNPKPTATVQRCLFNSRIRKQGETVAQYVAALKKLAEHCGFQEAALKNMLRDRLICGINNERWQKRLLTEPDPDYDKALEVALALEAAEKSVQDLQAQGSKVIHNLEQRRKSPGGGSRPTVSSGEGAEFTGGTWERT